jgi:GNAT superfamily N-acetyltransferase
MDQPTQPVAQSVCSVRPVQPGDYARVAELAGQLGYPSTEEQICDRILGMQDPNQWTVLVAELADGTIAGWVGLYIFRPVAAEAAGRISGMVVDQTIRSRGVGRALLHAAEEWSRSKGCKAVTLVSNVVRERAHQFYINNRYVVTKTQHAFRKDL